MHRDAIFYQKDAVPMHRGGGIYPKNGDPMDRNAIPVHRDGIFYQKIADPMKRIAIFYQKNGDPVLFLPSLMHQRSQGAELWPGSLHLMRGGPSARDHDCERGNPSLLTAPNRIHNFHMNIHAILACLLLSELWNFFM